MVSSIADAAKALEQPWPFMTKSSRLDAFRVLECMAGHCSQQAAIEAFKAAIKQKPPSVGIKALSGVAEELK
ncbi:DUF982 domain-containing protein [Mesorhizobium sp. M1378]|uniref:DUF982 domain-containing protein n=1 Tax=unclassified Mesorhizobium TaxID=325217 RepID=UPI00333D2024